MKRKTSNRQKTLKILAIGDMHGKVPKNVKRIVEREQPDLIINTGDFCDAEKSRRLIFKNWDLLEFYSFSDIVGKKKLQKIYSEELKTSYAPIKFLKSLRIPVFTITGNNDFTRKDVNYLKLNLPSFEDLIRGSNINLLKRTKFSNLLILGKSGYFGFSDKNLKKRVSELKKLFKGSKGRRTIFVTHSPPRGALDKVGWKKSPMYKKRVGDFAFRKAIEKYKPALNICAHMHENQGIGKLGKTKVLNLGLAKDGLFLISLSGNKISIRKVYK